MTLRKGQRGDVYAMSGESSAFTNAATTANAAKTIYTITTAANRRMDKDRTITVESTTDGANWTPVTSGFHLHYALGQVHFDEAQGGSVQIRVTGNKFGFAKIGQCKSWKLDVDINIKPHDVFGNDWEESEIIGGSAQVTIGQWYLDTYFLDNYDADLLVMLYYDYSNTKGFVFYLSPSKDSVDAKNDDFLSEDSTYKVIAEVGQI